MEYTKGKIIGKGAFSTVWVAKTKKTSTSIPPTIAVKSSTMYLADMLLQEELILKELEDCPCIIKCFGTNNSNEKGERLCNLLLEYASGGTLAQKLKKHADHRFLECDIRRYTKSILEGVNYIHEKGYVHRDLKLENILLSSSSKGARSEAVKIADFGMARKAGENVKGEASKLGGTLLYLAPETVNNFEQEPPADVWAVGCLVAEMFSGVPLWRPRQGDDAVAVLTRIALFEVMPEILGKLSPQAKDFLGKILIKDPAKRWTARMLIDHPFIVDQWCEQPTPLSSSPRGPLYLADNYKSSQSACSVTKIPSKKLKKGKGLSMAERFKRIVTCQGFQRV